MTSHQLGAQNYTGDFSSPCSELTAHVQS